MAATAKASNRIKLTLLKALETHDLIAILMKPDFIFDEDVHGTKADLVYNVWASGTIAEDTIVTPTTLNGHRYKCTTAGTTGGTEPSWATGDGSTTNDGTVVWTEIGNDDPQLPTLNGYTQDAEVLAGVSVTQDNTTDKAILTADDYTVTAAGAEGIGPTGSMVIYDDTITEKPVIGTQIYGTNYQIADTSSLLFREIKVTLGKVS